MAYMKAKLEEYIKAQKAEFPLLRAKDLRVNALASWKTSAERVVALASNTDAARAAAKAEKEAEKEAKTQATLARTAARAACKAEKHAKIDLPTYQEAMLMPVEETEAFNALEDVSGQERQYIAHGATSSVMMFVKLTSKTFGTMVEQCTIQRFGLSPRINEQHDALYMNRKIEIKSARYWGTSDDNRWQHLFPTYDYDILLLVLLDYTGFRYWAIRKGHAFETHFIVPQGDQGYWFKRSDMHSHLTPLYSQEDLARFVTSL